MNAISTKQVSQNGRNVERGLLSDFTNLVKKETGHFNDESKLREPPSSSST